MTSIKEFVNQPLARKVNRRNILTRLEDVEDAVGAKPSARVGALSELALTTGDLLVSGKIEVTDAATGGAQMRINETGVHFASGDAMYFEYPFGVRAVATIASVAGVDGLFFEIDAARIGQRTVLINERGDVYLYDGDFDTAQGWFQKAGVDIPLYLSFTGYTHTSPISASPAYPFAASADASSTLTFTRWSQSWFVATTNDGSNYWTVALVGPGDASAYASFTTAAGSAATWTLANTTTFSTGTIAPAGAALIVRVTKTGAPGKLSLASSAQSMNCDPPARRLGLLIVA